MDAATVTAEVLAAVSADDETAAVWQQVPGDVQQRWVDWIGEKHFSHGRRERIAFMTALLRDGLDRFIAYTNGARPRPPHVSDPGIWPMGSMGSMGS